MWGIIFSQSKVLGFVMLATAISTTVFGIVLCVIGNIMEHHEKKKKEKQNG